MKPTRVHPTVFLTRFFLAFCTALPFVVDYGVGSNNFFLNIYVSIKDTWLLSVLTASAFAALTAIDRRVPRNWRYDLLSGFLGVWWVLSRSVEGTGKLLQPFLSKSQIIKYLLCAIGMACVYSILIRLLDLSLIKRKDINLHTRSEFLSRIFCCYREHTHFFCASVLFLIWLPRLILQYPVVVNNDSKDQLAMILGLRQLTDHHPVLGTELLRIPVLASRWIGGNPAFFLWTVFQAVFCAWVLGYVQLILRKMSSPVWLRLLTMLVTAFSSLYRWNIGVLLKDIPYTMAAVLLLCELIRVRLPDGSLYSRSPGFYIRTVISCVLLLKMRHNGFIVFFPTFICVILQAIQKRHNLTVIRACSVFLISLTVSTALDVSIKTVRHVEPGSAGEAFSLFFQQTARYVTEHENEIPETEKLAINAILDYETLVAHYDPVISDGIKRDYKRNATLPQLCSYFLVWFRQGMRDPGCYFSAFFIQNRLIFDPKTYNQAIFTATGLPEEIASPLNISRPFILDLITHIIASIRFSVLAFPGLEALSSLAFYCIFLLVVLCFYRVHGLKGIPEIFLPSLCTLFLLFLCPTIVNQDRYGFIISYCMPLVLASVCHSLQHSSTISLETAP